MHALQHRSSVAQLFAVLALACALPFTSHAADPQLKIGSLVPKNSLYHRQLMEVGEVGKRANQDHLASMCSPMAARVVKQKWCAGCALVNCKQLCCPLWACEKLSLPSLLFKTCHWHFAHGKNWTMCARRCDPVWKKSS